MPIYAYRCASCGFAKDVLQKMSDSPLEVCPSCAQTTFRKQLTAAGFQLKGSGWYATDFKGGAAKSASEGASSETSGSEPAPAKTETAAPASPAATPSTAGAAVPTNQG